MKKQDILIYSNVIMAISTFVGVGGAIAYYMKTKETQIVYIILTEVIYVMALVILLMGIKDKVK